MSNDRISYEEKMIILETVDGMLTFYTIKTINGYICKSVSFEEACRVINEYMRTMDE